MIPKELFRSGAVTPGADLRRAARMKGYMQWIGSEAFGLAWSSVNDWIIVHVRVLPSMSTALLRLCVDLTRRAVVGYSFLRRKKRHAESGDWLGHASRPECAGVSRGVNCAPFGWNRVSAKSKHDFVTCLEP
jgi:hypothetical protein